MEPSIKCWNISSKQKTFYCNKGKRCEVFELIWVIQNSNGKYVCTFYCSEFQRERVGRWRTLSLFGSALPCAEQWESEISIFYILLGKVHIFSSNYYSIVNIPPNYQLCQLSPLNYQKMSMSPLIPTKDKNNPNFFWIRQKCPYKFEKKN
jgi:hypothetical protein